MNVLVGCEFSGIVRDAFKARGHYAVSCDLRPTERPGHHYQGDVFDAVHSGVKWDLAIFHPPCTFTAVSGNRWMNLSRKRKQNQAIKFFLELWNSPIERVVMEHPVSVMSTAFREPDQYIQPWMFGHPENKKTCLWVRGVEPLKGTRNVYAAMIKRPLKKRDRVHHEAPGEERQKNRSRTYLNIARAMAEQWG